MRAAPPNAHSHIIPSERSFFYATTNINIAQTFFIFIFFFVMRVWMFDYAACVRLSCVCAADLSHRPNTHMLWEYKSVGTVLKRCKRFSLDCVAPFCATIGEWTFRAARIVFKNLLDGSKMILFCNCWHFCAFNNRHFYHLLFHHYQKTVKSNR